MKFDASSVASRKTLFSILDHNATTGVNGCNASSSCSHKCDWKFRLAASRTRLRSNPPVQLSTSTSSTPSMKATMSHISNPLATPSQLYQLSSSNALPIELQDSIRFYTARLTQAAGILLRLPQDITAQANVLLFRYWLVDDLMAHEFSVRSIQSPSTIFSIQNTFASMYRKLIEPGRLSSNHLPNCQNLRLPTLPTQHHKRLRISPLPILLALLESKCGP